MHKSLTLSELKGCNTDSYWTNKHQIHPLVFLDQSLWSRVNNTFSYLGTRAYPSCRWGKRWGTLWTCHQTITEPLRETDNHSHSCSHSHLTAIWGHQSIWWASYLSVWGSQHPVREPTHAQKGPTWPVDQTGDLFTVSHRLVSIWQCMQSCFEQKNAVSPFTTC